MSSVRRLRARSSSVNGLMRMPMNGGSVPLVHARRDLVARRLGVAVLLGVGAVAVAVLEVDAEVLDRLAGDELPAGAGAQICAGYKALLIEGTQRDRDRGAEIDDHRQRNGAERSHVDRGQARREHEHDAGEATSDPGPLSAAEPLAQERRGKDRREQGLAGRDQTGNAGGETLCDRPPHASEIAAMQQHTGDDAVGGLACACGPWRPACNYDQHKDDDRAPAAHGEKGEGICIRRGIFCYDEAARP